MNFTPTKLEGVYVFDLEPHVDERGFFARAWCADELAELGLDTRVAQCNIAYNERAGTLRGLHFQLPPHEETKVVRCMRGAVYDVVVDLRRGSPTFRQWLAVELSEDNRKALYVPPGLAHGYQTLADASETFYLVSTPYAPGFEGGVRWDDDAFGVAWPDVTERIMNDRDRSWPDFVG